MGIWGVWREVFGSFEGVRSQFVWSTRVYGVYVRKSGVIRSFLGVSAVYEVSY